MNIQNRLEKLEARTLGNDSEHCGCASFPLTETYFQKGSDGVPMANGKPMPPQPEMCADCRKPLDKQITIIQFVPAGGPPLVHDPSAATFNISTRKRTEKQLGL